VGFFIEPLNPASFASLVPMAMACIPFLPYHFCLVKLNPELVPENLYG